MSSYTPGYVAWKLAFQSSPILLTNGILSGLPGLALPIIAITEAINFPLGLLTGGNVDLEKFYATFEVLPGASVIDQEIGRYPFANQAIAANAVIAQPLQLSYRMVAPAQERFGMFTKLAIMTALIEALKRHNQSGGTYICLTPSYIYVNCVMRAMRSTPTGRTVQPQDAWQLDFEKPLITLSDADAAMNGLNTLMSTRAQIPGNPATVAWTGLNTGATVPGSIAGPAIMPAQLPSVAANTASAGSASP